MTAHTNCERVWRNHYGLDTRSTTVSGAAAHAAGLNGREDWSDYDNRQLARELEMDEQEIDGEDETC
jgi:hypothetical protein